MATTNVPPTGGGSNPQITDIEPVSIDIGPEPIANGVRLEVVDRTGNGFRTIFDLDVTLDVVLKLVGAVARLRGITAP